VSSTVSIDQALLDEKLLGGSLGDPETWRTWLAVLRGAFGLPLNPGQSAIFRRLCDRDPPASRPRELWFIAGRRSGKSRMAGALGAYVASLSGLRARLAPGEVGRVMTLAPSVEQAKLVHGYARAFLEDSRF
jgi:hypothetical protein